MSFNITLYRNASEKNAINKVLTELTALTGNLKAGTSIIDPVILIENDLGSSVSGTVLANYVSVPMFARNYFITDIVSVSNSVVELHCHVDVLTSFKEQILSNRGIIKRQENEWNLYLNDGSLHIYQNPIVTTHEFPLGFEGQTYVLLAAGKHGGGIALDGTSSTEGKSLGGLAQYALAHVGCPYWWGAYGQVASQNLYDQYKYLYPATYTSSAYSNYQSDFGYQVFDCVGLIKGYRWSDSITGVPTYNISQDVDVEGMHEQCPVYRGTIDDYNWNNGFNHQPGVLLFTSGDSHVGVSMGDGTVVEARGRAYGVVQTSLISRPFIEYGVPQWLTPARYDPQ